MTPPRRAYFASALVGVLAGALYRLLDVPSPAPPWVALAGLLGILLGEHATRTALQRLRRRGGDQRHDPTP